MEVEAGRGPFGREMGLPVRGALLPVPAGRGALPAGRGAPVPVRIELPPGRGAPGRVELLPEPEGRDAPLLVPEGRGAPPVVPDGRAELLEPVGRGAPPVELAGRAEAGRAVEDDVEGRVVEAGVAGRGLGFALPAVSVAFFSACSGLASGVSIVDFSSSPIPSSLCQAFAHTHAPCFGA